MSKTIADFVKGRLLGGLREATLGSKEHYGVMAQFDQEYSHRRRDKEPKENWARGIVYRDGTTNELFLAYRRGYTLGKSGLL